MDFDFAQRHINPDAFVQIGQGRIVPHCVGRSDNRLPGQGRAGFGKLDFQITVRRQPGERIGLTLGPAPVEHVAHPRHELVVVVGLGQVVVGAALESSHLLAHITLGRHDDDGDLTGLEVLAQVLAHLEAVRDGQWGGQ